MKNRVTLLNISVSLLGQVVSIVFGLIVPRIILSTFGSSLNGLTASIGQFLSYIALLEGGVTGVVIANIYKPLVNNDFEKISSILATAKSFYKKIGLIFIIYTIILAFVYPTFINKKYDFWFVFLLTIISSLGLLFEYLFSITLTTLLNADKKIYIVSLTKIFLTIGNFVLVMLITKYYPNLLVLKAATSVLFVFQPLIYSIYIKKHYKINWKAPKDNNLIKQRWSGFSINFAAFIHGCTDITVLTLFCDLKVVSIYSIYYLVINKMRVLVNSVTTSIEPTVGQAYAVGNQEELNKKMDLFEYVTFLLTGLLFSLTAILITPFVQIYTKGINDANYYQPVFGILLVLSEAIYMFRSPHVILSYSANKFKEISVPSYIEAGLNVVLSVIFVKIWGIIGVTVATVIAMAYRMIFHVSFTRKLIPGRKQWIFYKKLLFVLLIAVVGYFINNLIYPFSEYTIKTWILHGIVYFCIYAILFFIISITIFKKEFNLVMNYVFKRGK